MHASLAGDWAAGWVPDAFDSVLSGDARDGRIPAVILALWADGATHSAWRRELGAAMEADRTFPWWPVSVVRCGRSSWSWRYGVDADLLHGGKHAAALSRRKGDGVMDRALGSVRRDFFLRWWRFNLVGGIGIAVQLGLLFLLKSVFHCNYLVATALAVEATVVHNFFWHERYTWVGRVQPSWRTSLIRLLRFNLTNG